MKATSNSPVNKTNDYEPLQKKLKSSSSTQSASKFVSSFRRSIEPKPSADNADLALDYTMAKPPKI